MGNEAEWKSTQLAEVETQRDGLKEECKKLKTLCDGVLSEMQQEQEKAAEESSKLYQTIDSLRSEKERVEQDAATWEQLASDLREEVRVMQEQKELELLRAMAEEKARSEAREHRLTALLEQQQEQLGVITHSGHLPWPQPTIGTIDKAVHFAPDLNVHPIDSTVQPATHTWTTGEGASGGIGLQGCGCR